MACTTILVGKKASYDGSTMIARNDDSPSGVFHVKKLIVVKPEDQPKEYVSKISHVRIPLPENPLRYTAMPNVDPKEGVWAANGINACDVSMSATETITSNERVYAADPLVEYVPKKGKAKEKAGGIGEEDLVCLVLPYIRSAREGVLRLGSLLEEYGTYENNGIAFSDADEIWWLETIGGHHWIARRVPDDRYVVMPNQFGLDHFDFEDALGEKREYMCSADLLDFVRENHLALDQDDKFNPRLAFGSHSDSDHVYNTPRAWYMGRYFNPRTYRWDGENADFTPRSDDIPWSFIPERKITVEDVKYILSSHFQGTEYDPYLRFGDMSEKGSFRPIGVNRTSFLHCNQIKRDKGVIQSVEWFAFGSNVFNAFIPIFPQVDKIPTYFSKTSVRVTSESFYWINRIIASLSDPHFNLAEIHIQRYQESVQSKASRIVKITWDEYLEKKDPSVFAKANEEIAALAKEESEKCLEHVLYENSMHMKNSYARSDN